MKLDALEHALNPSASLVRWGEEAGEFLDSQASNPDLHSSEQQRYLCQTSDDEDRLVL